MKCKPIILFVLILLLVNTGHSLAQPTEQLVKVIVQPDHADWNYRLGETVKFYVQILQNNVPVNGAIATCQSGPERMEPLVKQKLTMTNTGAQLDGGTLKQPGFLRCIVTTSIGGKTYRGLCTVGFDVEHIMPTVTLPAGFNSFWDKGKAELASLPIDARLTLLPEKCSALSNVYMVNLQSYAGSRLYAILCVPKKEGKYPAVLQVPGAGIRPYGPDLEMADKGLIVLTIGIHGIPVNLDPSVYSNLEAGALKGYFFFNADNRDRYYYKRVYLGCIRANDFISSLPQFNGRLAVSGNSQGGALSIITASLDHRVNFLAAIHPALCDLTGYFNGRAGGWPHIFDNNNAYFGNTPQVRQTMPYYDVVNFAKGLKTEGFYTWGYNDETCPPTSMYAAYNSITAKKYLSVFKDTGHWFYPEQKGEFNNWIIGKLKANQK